MAKSAGVTRQIAEAMNHLISTGAYQKILKRWSVTYGLVKSARIFS